MRLLILVAVVVAVWLLIRKASGQASYTAAGTANELTQLMGMTPAQDAQAAGNDAAAEINYTVGPPVTWDTNQPLPPGIEVPLASGRA